MPDIHRRFHWFVWVIGVWALIIVLRMATIMIVNREQFLADMTRESWHRGMIPAPRGRILDSSGLPLAWSVRQLQLHWEVPADPTEAWKQWEALVKLPDLAPRIGARDIPELYGRKNLLVDDLPACAAAPVRALIRTHTAFSLVPWFVRYQTEHPDLRQGLGYTIQRNGMEIGLDGYEKLHDGVLRGRPGIFRVMVDARGEWIMSTWEIVQQMQPGYDVFLPRTKQRQK